METRFRVYKKDSMEIIAKNISWEDFIQNYGWKKEYEVASWSEAIKINNHEEE